METNFLTKYNLIMALFVRKMGGNLTNEGGLHAYAWERR